MADVKCKAIWRNRTPPDRCGNLKYLRQCAIAACELSPLANHASSFVLRETEYTESNRLARLADPSSQMYHNLCCCLNVLEGFFRLSKRFRNYRQLVQASSSTMASEEKEIKREATEQSGENSTQRTAMACNPGKKSRNPYINYLRDFRRRNCHLPAVEVIRQGAMHWRRMTDEEKLPTSGARAVAMHRHTTGLGLTGKQMIKPKTAGPWQAGRYTTCGGKGSKLNLNS
uniref:HMG box domain-containing protein n=1 Tax=Anopheles farauti TaxID=69004 RepID=A0A182Q6A6_9DIPT